MRWMNRYTLLSCCLFTLIGTVMYRMISLHVLEQDFLRHQGQARTMRVVHNSAYRGMITDRFGEPMAISTPVDSLWLNPKEFDSEHPQLLALVGALDISLEQLQNKVRRAENREFVYVQRHLSPQVAEEIKRLRVPGVYLKSEYRRYYPAGEVTAHVLGFTNIDDLGQEGLELAFDESLKGTMGSKRIIRDRLGREVQIIEGLKERRSGQDIALSLDQRLQYLAYRELKAAVLDSHAVGGSAVILDVKTGEVLAMVNQPSFNPNQRVKLSEDRTRLRNRAVIDTFEPGSAMKTFSVVSALQHGGMTPKTLVDTSPGWLTVGGHVVKEDYNRNFGLIDVATILEKSSNVGVSKLTLLLPPDRLWETYTSMGFGNSTGSGFPGESAGVLNRPAKNGTFILTTMAFGYGMSVTPLQLAQAYAILGAGGVKRPITFLKTDISPVGERMIEPTVAKQVVDMLTGVVQQGCGVKAQVVGYQTAGKTGTARKVASAGGYQKDSHVAVFAGLAPASNPRFAIVVMVDDPKGPAYYGSQVAAPVFSKIAGAALRLYNIAPDSNEDNFRIAHVVEDGVSLHE